MFLLSEAALFFVRLYIVPIILLFPCVFKKYIYCMEYYARCKSTALTVCQTVLRYFQTPEAIFIHTLNIFQVVLIFMVNLLQSDKEHCHQDAHSPRSPPAKTQSR